MKRWFALLVLIALMTAVSGSATAETGTVHGGWLVLRETPSFNGTILASYPSGTVVTVTGKNGSWYSVLTADGKTGYMLGSYLTVSGNAGLSGSYGETAYVTSSNGLNVRLRSGPGTGYSILAAFAPGTRCTILSTGTNWCRIQIGGYSGYMMSRYLTTNPVPPVSPGAGYTVYVTSRNGLGVNLRSGPGKDYPSIGFYSVGTEAMMMNPSSVWSYILIGSRYGYMMTEFLSTTRPSPGPSGLTAYVTSPNGQVVNLRSGPSTGYPVIRSFPVMTPVTVISRGSSWYYVRVQGYYGYMMSRYICYLDEAAYTQIGGDFSMATSTDLH